MLNRNKISEKDTESITTYNSSGLYKTTMPIIYSNYI